MKKKYVLMVCLLLSFFHLFSLDGIGAKVTLKGKITDKKTGDPLPGVNVYLPDLKTGTTSDSLGNYSIRNLPPASVLVQLNYISYRTLIEKVDLSVTNVANFEMEYAATEINEVIITGMSKSAEQKRTPTPITVVSRLVLLQSASTNIIDALSLQPGISQITTGTGISKPVIRGLGYNRVVVVNDGTRQEGQQWGDEHGIEIDEYSVDKVEILKGPASLAYGSDALAGVINMLSAPTLQERKIAANFTSNYQSNNGLIGFSAGIAGNNNGMVWDFRYSYKVAHAYRDRYDGYVLNSGFRENSMGFLIGLNKAWGYSHLKISTYNMTPGIIEGERDSLTGNFTRPIALNDSTEGSEIVSGKALRSYTPITPYQKIHHYKAVLNSNFIIGNSSLKTIFGLQQNQRQEYGNVLKPNRYDLYFLLNTLNYDVRYILPEFRKLSVSIGVNGMYQESGNKGDEYLVPEYNLFDFGVFAIAKKSLGNVDISGGLRYDTRLEHGKDLYLNAKGEKVASSENGSDHRFTSFNSTFTGFSGSLGTTWQISRALYAKFNLSRGFRAPNIGELGSNGVHEGTLRFEKGNPYLKAENSFEVDFTMGLNSEHISAELDVFNNNIQHYIFSRKLAGAAGGDSITDGVETFMFVSGNAHLKGGEFRIDIHPHPLDWIHFENSISLVSAVQNNQPDSARYLPMIPAAKVQSSLRADIKRKNNTFKNAYIKIEFEHYMKQNHYYSAFGTETETAGYSLVNLGLGTDIIMKDHTLCSVYVSLNNLTDVTYQSHLSRLKYGPVNLITGRTGIYNMGRNISFKILIPVNLN
jgi:iron complex outermembrane recepter protein